MKQFWLWLCRFAYRRCASSMENRPVGLPLYRDPDAICEAYEPRKKRATDWDDCVTDGHYLCKECCHRHPDDPWDGVSQ